MANCNTYQPTASFDAGSGPVSFRDSGHVLDTFGYDLINLPAPAGDGNESIDWSLIETAATRSGSVVPEPGSALLLAAG